MVPEKNDKDEMGNTIKANKEVKGPIVVPSSSQKKEQDLKSMYYTKADEKQQKTSYNDDQKER